MFTHHVRTLLEDNQIMKMTLKLRKLPTCCSLDTLVICLGLCLTCAYMMLGLAGLGWFITSTSRAPGMVKMKSLSLVRMDTMMGSLAMMGAILVTAFVGMLTSLLLIVGVKTMRRLLLIPWQSFHALLSLGCLAGGLYQAVHHLQQHMFWVTLSIGSIILLAWFLVQQLSSRMRSREMVDSSLQEKRAVLATIHTSVQLGKEDITRWRSDDNILEYDGNDGRRTRWKSDENILNFYRNDYDHIATNRSRSLPRHLEQNECLECFYNNQGYAAEDKHTCDYRGEKQFKSNYKKWNSPTYNTPKSSTLSRISKDQQDTKASSGNAPINVYELYSSPRKKSTNSLKKENKNKNKEDEAHGSFHSKSVSIHPEVTQYRYKQYKYR